MYRRGRESCAGQRSLKQNESDKELAPPFRRGFSCAGRIRRMATTTIYVYMVDEGVDVWRPVQAVRASHLGFRFTGEIPSDEVWSFRPGEVVRCEERTFADGNRGLVAVAKIE